MAEQFLRAYHVRVADLHSITGSNDKAILKAATKKKHLYEEVDDLIREWTELKKKPAEDGQPFGLDHALQDIISGNLDTSRCYEYFRTLEVMLEIKGKILEDEVVFPGRGWQDIRAELIAWGLPTLGKAWCRKDISFPWREGNSMVPDWPSCTLIINQEISKLKQEVENFDQTILKKHRLSERHKGLEAEVIPFLHTLEKWLDKANKDLVLLLDGQQ